MAFVNCNCISRRMAFRRMTFRNHWKCKFFTGKLPFRMTLRMTLRNHWKCQLYTAILPLWMTLWNANANDIEKSLKMPIIYSDIAIVNDIMKCKCEWHYEMTFGNCQNANLNDIVKSKYFLAQNKKLRSYFGLYTPNMWRKEFETSRGPKKKMQFSNDIMNDI